MVVTVRYGMNTVQLDRPEGTTVGSLVKDANARAVLGFGDNVVPVIEGATMGTEFILGDQDEVVLQPRAAIKGS